MFVAALATLMLQAAPATPPATQPATRPTVFPSVAGDNLNNRRVELPGGLDAPYAVLLVAFEREQQGQVDTWLAACKAVVADHANVEYYELPTIGRRYGAARGFIDGGMRRGIPAFADRERTVTLYLDVREFRDAAGIDDPSRIWVGLIDRRGTIHWTARGAATGDALDALRGAVTKTAAPDAPAAR